VFFYALSDYVPDQPSYKGNDHLNNTYDQPQNGHDQEKDKLKEKKDRHTPQGQHKQNKNYNYKKLGYDYKIWCRGMDWFKFVLFQIMFT